MLFRLQIFQTIVRFGKRNVEAVQAVRQTSNNNNTTANLSPRLFIRCILTGILFLIDCGSDVSVLPGRFIKYLDLEIEFDVTAANGSKIRTYGLRSLKLNLGLTRTFT